MTSASTRNAAIVLACGLACGVPARLAAADVVSYRCAMALDAVLAELDSQAQNAVTQKALERIDENSGEFVCVVADANTIYVRLQAPDMVASESKLVFTIDATSYEVLKTTYGP